MKYKGYVSLWNKDQWHHCWRPHNILRLRLQKRYVPFAISTFSILGFTFFFDRWPDGPFDYHALENDYNAGMED